MNNNLKRINSKNRPWAWVPTTYTMQAIPTMLLMTSLAIMYKNFELSNEQITFYIGLILIPYSLKPLWASFIDILGTKRIWTFISEILIGALIIFLAISLQFSNFLLWTIAISWAIAFASASQNIATDGFFLLALNSEQQAFFQGFRTMGFEIGAILVKGILIMMVGILFEHYTHNYFTAWSFALIFFGLICISIGIYHYFAIPKIEINKKTKSLKFALLEFKNVYVDFFKLPQIFGGIIFLLFFAVSETSLSVIAPLFLKDSISAGGLNLSNEFLGFIYGVLATFAILVAAILGGLFICKRGLKKSMWIMLIILNSGHIIYILLAYFQPQNQVIIASAIVLEKFMFMFGYSAYFLFIIYLVKDSNYKTAHYSFLMALMMFIKIPFKMVSGYIEVNIGYTMFFTYILILIIPAIIGTMLIKINPEFGKIKNIKL